MIKVIKEEIQKQLTRQDFIDKVIKDGQITIDDDGGCIFVTTQINTKNFKDMSDKFIKQLKDEGKYNSYISFISSDKSYPYSVMWLPIYGNAERYVTASFKSTPEEAMQNYLKDRNIQLLKRANKYIEANSKVEEDIPKNIKPIRKGNIVELIEDPKSEGRVCTDPYITQTNIKVVDVLWFNTGNYSESIPVNELVKI